MARDYDDDRSSRRSKKGFALSPRTVVFLIILIVGIGVGIALDQYILGPLLNYDLYNSLDQSKTDNSVLNADLQKCLTKRDQLDLQLRLCQQQ